MTLPHSSPNTTFTPDERQALVRLRARHEHKCDCFSTRERARLRFLQWLYETGRLTS